VAGVGGAAWLEILSKNNSRANTPGGAGGADVVGYFFALKGKIELRLMDFFAGGWKEAAGR